MITHKSAMTGKLCFQGYLSKKKRNHRFEPRITLFTMLFSDVVLTRGPLYPVLFFQETPGVNEIHRPARIGSNIVTVVIGTVTGSDPSAEIICISLQ